MAYDYIIIGTGAAGAVLAERLSASGKNTVLVLESGGSDRDPTHRVPKGWVFTMQNKKYVKKYRPEPFGDGTVEVWPRGMIEGGSTTVNGLGWNTGEAAGYDWDALGNEGWSWQAFRDALDRIENRRRGRAGRNPRNGRMNVEVVSTKGKFGDTALRAFERSGAPTVESANLSSGPRSSYAETNSRAGMRWSAASAFLKPAVRRKNVTFIKHAHVSRILFSGTTAIGVEADIKGTLHSFAAGREVLVCAGSLESPMLLERSGIGAPEVLEAAGVGVIAASPKVGENLSEHRGFTILYHLANGLGFNHAINTPLRQLFSGIKFLLTRRGVISSGSFDAFAFFDLDEGTPGAETMVAVAGISYGEGMKPERQAGGLIAGYPLYPTSRGSIHITGPRVADEPRIVVPYFRTDYDKRTMVQAVRHMRSVLDTPEMQSMGATEYYPGPGVATDDEIVAQALNFGPYGYHTLGTCAIGPDDDDVVDSRLRVRGVRGVRVIDASVFPHQPSGNNSAPTSAAAWIAADMILEDARVYEREEIQINAVG
ncbi:GMC family oxidoreductase [Microbacterium sp. 22303]|uniref:GMC family oxidoreductase n=1 Tax=Microbacterium sp. 22303 TaxID=3453905 RepID=UPI003F852915